MVDTNNVVLSFDNLRDDVLHVFAEETKSLSFARDFVTTFTINPSVQEDEDFTIRLTEILCAIAPSESIHTRTLGTIAFHFSLKVFFFQIDNVCIVMFYSIYLDLIIIGPCPYGQVLTIDSDDRLKCTLSLCSARPPSTSYPINEAVY